MCVCSVCVRACVVLCVVCVCVHVHHVGVRVVFVCCNVISLSCQHVQTVYLQER